MVSVDHLITWSLRDNTMFLQRASNAKITNLVCILPRMVSSLLLDHMNTEIGEHIRRGV